MKRFAIIALSLAFVACGPKEDKPSKTPDEPSKAAEEHVDGGDKASQKELKKEEEKPVDARIAALEKEWSLYQDKVLAHSAKDLSDGEKEMMRHLLNAARITEELNMLQLHPKNLQWKAQVDESGTEIEQKVFERYQSPWCAEDESPECCAVSSKPERKIGAMHWPEDLTDEEYEKLGTQINGKELLSPFTVVTRSDSGKLEAIPYSQSEILGEKMKDLAGELRLAAKTAPDKSLVKFLNSRADALEADDAYPYDASDYDWIAVKGDWEVTVGPYETYKNPRQSKALFEMYIGKEDKETTAELAQFKENLQDMEDALGALVGPEIYKSRKLDPRIAIRAVDIWMAAGDGRKDRGATVAFHLPNRGKSVDEGLYKKVMMVNHSLAFEEVSKARAELILSQDQVSFVDPMSDIKNVTFHEFAHGFGAYHEMKVTNPKGKETTVKEALKEYDSLLEEAKADTFGLWLLSFQKKKGWVNEEQEKRRYTSALMHILGLQQYPLAGTYPRMVSIQVGWYLDAGAVTWDDKEERYTVHFDKMPAAVESLAKEIATIQLTGDYARAEKLVGKYMEKKGEKDYVLKGKLAECRDKMMAKFKAANITSPSLRYKVTDL